MNSKHFAHADFKSLVFTRSASDAMELEDALRAALMIAARDPSARVWSIYGLWAVGKPETGANVLQLEKDVGASVKGLQLPVQEIERLCSSFQQVVDVIIIGATSEAELPERKDLEAHAGAYQTKVELVDSTSVVLTTRSEVVATALVAELGFVINS